MTRERKSSKERKAEIVSAALDLMSERGASEVTAQAIADRIGIAQPTVFRHFGTRNAIFRAALQFIAGQLFDLLQRVDATRGQRADERLHGLLQRQLQIISRNRGLPRLLFSDRLHLEDPQLKKTVLGVMERYVTHVEGLILEGQEDGSFSQDLDPRTSAAFVAATVQGLLLRWSLYDFAFDLEGQLENLWRFVHSALTQPGESLDEIPGHIK